MLGCRRDPGLLEPGVAVTVAALFHSGQGREAPFKAIGAGRFRHLAHDPGAVGHKDGLIVQHKLLVLCKVVVVGIGRGGRLGVLGQLGNNVEAGLGLLGVPDAFFITRGLVEELGAARRVHQSVEESVEVTGGGVGKQADAFGLRLVAQLPHLIPGGGHFPALFFQQAGVIEQAAGAVEHGCQIRFAVAIRIGQGGIREATRNFILHLDVLTGHRHVQHIGNVQNAVVFNERFGQSRLAARGQMDDVGIIAGLHTRTDNILQLLVGRQFNRNAGVGSLKRRAHFFPHVAAIGRLDGGHLQRLLSGRRRAASRGAGACRRRRRRAGAAAAGEQGERHGEHQHNAK